MSARSRGSSRDPHVYPGTNVLINHFGISDPAELARREHDASAARLAVLQDQPLAGGYVLPHLQAFHRYIFGLGYPWAGEIRTVRIAETEMFALPQNIESYLGAELSKLPDESYLRGLSRDELVGRLTHYLAEINAVHPFRNGNGRAQRAFVGQLAGEAGYRLAWERLDPRRNVNASRASLSGDNSPFHKILAELIEPL